MEQARQIAEKQAQHDDKHVHIRITGIEWVHPGDFDQDNFPYGRYRLRDHKEEWSWMVKFLIYDDANEQKPYTSAEKIRVLSDGSIDEMMRYPEVVD